MQLPSIAGQQATQVEVDTIVTHKAFNYSLQFSPELQTVILNIFPVLQKTQLQFPFGRLEFANFVKQCSDIVERLQNAASETDENGTRAASENGG